MADIRIGQVGRIISGEDIGDFIKVIDDEQNTGGYLIFHSINEKFSGTVYDAWVENYSDLEIFLSEGGRVVEWLEE